MMLKYLKAINHAVSDRYSGSRNFEADTGLHPWVTELSCYTEYLYVIIMNYIVMILIIIIFYFNLINNILLNYQ